MRASSADPRAHLTQVVLSLECGGSETLARDIALGLDPSRFSTSICALDAGGPLEVELRAAAIPVNVLGRRVGFDWRLIPRLSRLFRSLKVQIVQTHHLTPLIYSALAARLAGARLVHVEHERFTYQDATARQRLRLLSTLCHRVVVVGDDIERYLVASARIPAAKITVIPNGVNLARYATAPRVSRSACGLPDDGRLIGHVARLDAAKDQATLLRSFKLVLNAHRDTRLVLVGDGPLRRELEALGHLLGISSRLTFLGLRADVAELLPHFEAFAFSSVSEGLPLAILEAMAAARPVVATAVGEIPTVVEHGVTGLLAPPGDPKSLADGLVRLLESPGWARDLGLAARSAVECRFSLRASVEQYQALFRALGPTRGT